MLLLRFRSAILNSGLESDEWSIGVITYILLCRRRPFWDKTENGIFKEALASTLDEEEIADLKDQFCSNRCGSISLEKMRRALAKDLPWKSRDSRVQEILQAIDSNTDVLVDFTEFVAATLHVHELKEHDSKKWEQGSQTNFDKFDVDKTPEKLRLMSHQFSFVHPWITIAHTGLRGSIKPLLEEAAVENS